MAYLFIYFNCLFALYTVGLVSSSRFNNSFNSASTRIVIHIFCSTNLHYSDSTFINIFQYFLYDDPSFDMYH